MVSPISGGSLTPVPPLNPAPPVAGALSDSSIEQISQSVIADFSNQPRLTISQYHSTVSEAVRLTQVADIIGRLGDGEARRQLFLAAIEEALRIADLNRKAVEYNVLKRQYDNLSLGTSLQNLSTQAVTLQSTIISSTQYSLLTSAIAAYNSDLLIYNGNLPGYTTGVTNYQNAINAYNSALNTWNSALSTFNAIASPTGADINTLFNAYQAFNTAKSTFDTAVSDFAPISSSMNSAQTNLDAAQSSLNNAVSVFNNYISTLSAQITVYTNLVNQWNTEAQSANEILAQMNLLARDLNLPISPLNTIIPTTSFDVTLPAATVNQDKADALDAYDALVPVVNSVNQFIINTVNPNISLAITNLSPQPAPFTILTPITGAAQLTGTSSQVPYVPNYSVAVPIPIAVGTPTIDPTSNIPTLSSLAELGNTIAAINQQDDSTNDSPFSKISRRAATEVSIGGSGSSTQLTNISPQAQAQNPFLSSTLSQQAIESIFNVYGVPANSALVDQIGAATATLTEASGILSTPLAQDLITTSSLNSSGQDTGIRFTLSLANLTGLSSLIEDGTLRQGLTQILQQDASFAALTPENQNALLDALTQEVGANLLKSALAYISEQFGMPGLIPQILVAAAGLGDGDALGSIQSQLYFAATFADQLQKNLGISADLAQTIANQAVTSGASDTAIQQSTLQSLNDQGVTPVSEDTLNTQIGQALAETKQIVNDSVAAQDQAQRQAFADSLTSSLLGQGILDQTQASRITQELINNSSQAVGEIAVRILRQFNLDQEELQQILTEAENAKSALDPSLNPIAAINATANATPESLQAGFEALARQVLAPAVGDAQALQIASDYGRLIFSSADSILARLQANESALRTQSSYNHAERLADDYQSYTADIRNPTTATGNPLQLGETLLLSANIGGPATAGTTSLDNQLGVFGNTHINPSGILG